MLPFPGTTTIHQTLEVQVPQLDVLGTKLDLLGAKLDAMTQALVALKEMLVDQLTPIAEALDALATTQADLSQALSDQLAAIANELAQDNIPAEAITALAARVHDAAAMAQKQADQIRANTDEIKGIIPDTPPPTP